MKKISSKRELTLVSIGLPVGSGDERVFSSVNSLLTQTHAHLELIVCGNPLWITTSDGAASLLRLDPRIRLVESPDCPGPADRYYFALQQAKGSFFMWASVGDNWEPDFVSNNLSVLDHDSKVVCSISRVTIVDDQANELTIDPGTRSLCGSPRENIPSFLLNPGANSRFFGLFRTEVLKESFRETDTYWASDWAIMARTLTWGKHVETSSKLFRRSIHGISSDINVNLPEFNRNWLTRRFPMLPLTWTILTDPTLPVSWGLFRALWRWNVRYRRHARSLNSERNHRLRFAYPALQRIGSRRRAA